MKNENLSKQTPEALESLDNDDRPVGRILSRREVLALFGAIGATLLVGCGPTQSGSDATTTLNAEVEAANGVAASACVVRPEQTEGPYFVDEQLDRSDIRTEPSSGEMKAVCRLG